MAGWVHLAVLTFTIALVSFTQTTTALSGDGSWTVQQDRWQHFAAGPPSVLALFGVSV